ncbi:hypothetical protein, partial [Deinococcus sp.]|uniref:hypothetical protein n=1 Tax=Deinococcus sp. TaxID=47478 RepID=UPI0025F3770C
QSPRDESKHSPLKNTKEKNVQRANTPASELIGTPFKIGTVKPSRKDTPPARQLSPGRVNVVSSQAYLLV